MATIIAPFFNTDNETNGSAGATLLARACDVVATTLDGVTYVYVAAFTDWAVQVFSLDAAGQLSPVGSFVHGSGVELRTPENLALIETENGTFLSVKGVFANTLFRLDATTGLGTATQSLFDTSTTSLGGTGGISTADIGGTTYLFYAGEDAVSSLALDPVAGTLTQADRVLDSDLAGHELAGAVNVETVVVGGSTYLLAAGGTDDGISVFGVAGDGTLTNTENVTDTAALELDGVFGMATAEVNGTTYLYAAGRIDNGISAFSVSAAGTLTNVFNYDPAVTGSLFGLREPGELTAITYDGASILIASCATGDNLVAFSVEDDGSLVEIDGLYDFGALELDGTLYSSFLDVNGTPYLFASSLFDDGISAFEIGGQDDVLEGTSGDDDIFGFGQDDVLGGRGGADRLFGGTGNDILAGAGGSDTLRGGAGADTLLGGAGTDAIDYAGSGSAVTVSLQAGTASGGAAAGDVFFGIENLVGSSFADDLAGDGGANRINGAGGNDAIAGLNGNDSLNGAGGSDSILGGAGLDSISGGAGKDTIDGGADTDLIDGGVRRDILAGGAGDDTMTGGGGRDDFVFLDGDGADVITDFLVGTDRIDLRGHTGATDFASLVRFNVPGQGVLVQIDADDSIFILGVTSAQLLATDFQF